MSTTTFVPAYSTEAFSYVFTERSSCLAELSATVSPAILAHIQDHITRTYRNYTISPGISCAHLPLSYTREYFSAEITRDVKKFILDNFVSEGVLNYLNKNRIVIANWPRLARIDGDLDQGLTYNFTLSRAPALAMGTWEEHTFIPPRRKNYTDLDSQVEGFIQSLISAPDEKEPTTVANSDWVCFDAVLSTPLSGQRVGVYKSYWLHTAAPGIPAALTQAFIGKAVGNTFAVPVSLLSTRPEAGSATGYEFNITVKDIVPHSYLTEERLYSCFGVDSHQLLHDKLIEVFSFRNDISLRRSIIEELFYTLFSSYRFDVAPHAVTRRKESLLSSLQNNPDLQVYTKQKEFIPQITRLAETKLKEEALIDLIAREEGIEVSDRDINNYLQLTTHERLKEFLYFTPLNDDIDVHTEPLSHHLIANAVRREKTLNHIITRLSL